MATPAIQATGNLLHEAEDNLFIKDLPSNGDWKSSATTKGRLTWQLIFAVVVVSFGTWFPIGYSYASTNTPQAIIIEWIRSVKCARLAGPVAFSQVFFNDSQKGPVPAYDDAMQDIWCKAVAENEEHLVLSENAELNRIWAIVGATVGGGALLSLWSTNWWLKRFGSKNTMLINNFIGVVGTVLASLCVEAASFEMLIVGRFIWGVNIGISISVPPMYIAEISPASLRGATGTFPGVCFVGGAFTAVVLGLPQLLGGQNVVVREQAVFWSLFLSCIFIRY
ncbi:hypothetical protein RvY_06090-2 [Ramazzottius varieornatus]|uniref:Major facilitator superfamily (MFS) profile domain-containing protein n=1 Tax=Ramazzottius varieornatus TaxID=947166 RepID=A0A1D1UXD9_RAMVA|nr:hypothetical protein RvY_06090-2 [Ramazzottius varieornatus]